MAAMMRVKPFRGFRLLAVARAHNSGSAAPLGAITLRTYDAPRALFWRLVLLLQFMAFSPQASRIQTLHSQAH